MASFEFYQVLLKLFCAYEVNIGTSSHLKAAYSIRTGSGKPLLKLFEGVFKTLAKICLNQLT